MKRGKALRVLPLFYYVSSVMRARVKVGMPVLFEGYVIGVNSLALSLARERIGLLYLYPKAMIISRA